MSRHDELSAAIADATQRGRQEGIAQAAAMLRNRAVTLGKDAMRIHATGKNITDAVALSDSACIYAIAADAVHDMAPADKSASVHDLTVALRGLYDYARCWPAEDGSRFHALLVEADAALKKAGA